MDSSESQPAEISSVVTCIHCGHTCDKHPISEIERQNRQMRNALVAVRDYMDTPLGSNPDVEPVVRKINHALVGTSDPHACITFTTSPGGRLKLEITFEPPINNEPGAQNPIHAHAAVELASMFVDKHRRETGQSDLNFEEEGE